MNYHSILVNRAVSAGRWGSVVVNLSSFIVGASDPPGLAGSTMGGTLGVRRDFDTACLLKAVEAEKLDGPRLAPVMSAQFRRALGRVEPEALYLEEAPPRNPSGKILKRLLRAS